MKTHQGFIVFGRIPFLIGALLISGTALAGDAASKDKETVATPDQGSSTLPIASKSVASKPTEKSTAQQKLYAGTLYRNGGYFGDQNSDEKLEKGSR